MASNVQCEFRHYYGTKPPGTKSVKRWYDMFKETSRVVDLTRSGKHCVSEATVGHVRQSFQRNPKSTDGI
ncbi:hypothetical protein TNCV_1605591 [Trichonephila clavipes]|nr:hypothetical protein TNCV_1605591 [Trichonephila clavipes]